MPIRSDMAKDLTLFSWDSYPVTGWDNKGDDETYRLADPAQIGLCHDHMASFNNRFALMEFQPGHVNWSNVPVRLYPGAIRLWIWTAFAHGSEFVTTYRFRQPRFGIELFHDGLVGPDGVTPSDGGKQFAQVIEEMRRFDLSRIPKFAEEKSPSPETVGLILDFEQMWYYHTLPQARRWNQNRWLQIWYAALTRLGARIRILRPEAAWPDDLPLIVAPGLQMVDQKLVSRLDSYARAGGNLVLTCRTGLMDRTGQLWEGPWAARSFRSSAAQSKATIHCATTSSARSNSKERFIPGASGAIKSPQTAAPKSSPPMPISFTPAQPPSRGPSFGKGAVSYFGVCSEQSLVDTFVESLAKSIGPERLRSQIMPNRVQVFSAAHIESP